MRKEYKTEIAEFGEITLFYDEDENNKSSININTSRNAYFSASYTFNGNETQYTSYNEILNYIAELYDSSDSNNNTNDRVLLFTTDTKLIAARLSGQSVSVDFVYQYESNEIKTLLLTMCNSNGVSGDIVYDKINSKSKRILLGKYSILEILFVITDFLSKDKKLIKEFDIKTKSKVRHIIAPQDEFMTALKHLNVLLQSKFDRKNDLFQVAYKKGKSIVNNAEIHQGNKYVFKTDFKDFFPSCKRCLVEPVLDFLFEDYNGFNVAIIKDLFYSNILYKNSLFIGSPISGTIANYIISDAVLEMRSKALKYGIKMTVYADDITFSSDKVLYKKSVLEIVNTSLQKLGLSNYFKLNSKKCIGLSNQRRSITGIVFNHNDEMTTHRFRYEHIRQSLYQLSKGDTSHFRMSELKGQIAFVLPTDKSEKYARLFKKYKKELLDYKLISEENYEKFLNKYNEINTENV